MSILDYVLEENDENMLRDDVEENEQIDMNITRFRETLQGHLEIENTQRTEQPILNLEQTESNLQIMRIINICIYIECIYKLTMYTTMLVLACSLNQSNLRDMNVIFYGYHILYNCFTVLCKKYKLDPYLTSDYIATKIWMYGVMLNLTTVKSIVNIAVKSIRVIQFILVIMVLYYNNNVTITEVDQDTIEYCHNVVRVYLYNIIVTLCAGTIFVYYIYKRMMTDTINVMQNKLNLDMFTKTLKMTRNPNLINESCSICLETFTSEAQLSELACTHKFHHACLQQWISNYKNTCPLCRQNILNDMNLTTTN